MHMHQTNLLPGETARRVRAFRKAMGLRQGELAFVVEGEQPMVSQWEKEKIRNYSVLAPRLVKLADFLRDPSSSPAAEQVLRKKERSLMPEMHSPIALDGPAAATLAMDITNPNVSPEDWDATLAGQLWAHSGAPFRASRLLAAKAAGAELRQEDFLADLTVHGESFVNQLRAQWLANEEETRRHILEKERLAAQFGSQLVYLLLYYDPARPHRLSPEQLLEREFGEYVSGPWLEWRPELFLPAMHFLQRILSWCVDHSSGKLDHERVHWAWMVSRTFGEAMDSKGLAETDRWVEARDRLNTLWSILEGAADGKET